jgi:hypothetical protein
METVIIISKVDDVYLITSPEKNYGRKTLDEAMALVRELIEKPVVTISDILSKIKEDTPQGPEWVAEVLKAPDNNTDNEN